MTLTSLPQTDECAQCEHPLKDPSRPIYECWAIARQYFEGAVQGLWYHEFCTLKCFNKFIDEWRERHEHSFIQIGRDGEKLLECDCGYSKLKEES